MSRAAVGLMVLGVMFAVVGLVLAVALNDRFIGLALLLVAAFLIVLPLTRPSVDE